MAHGAPDWYRRNEPTRTFLGPGQQRYMLTGTADVPGSGGTLTQTITVAAGLDFNLALVVASCEVSCIQLLRIIKDSGIHIITRFDSQTSIPFPESGTYVIHSGETLEIEVTNNDTSARSMSTGVAGTVVYTV